MCCTAVLLDGSVFDKNKSKCHELHFGTGWMHAPVCVCVCVCVCESIYVTLDTILT